MYRVRAAGLVQALLIVFLITQCGGPKREFRGAAGASGESAAGRAGGAGSAGIGGSAPGGGAGHSGGSGASDDMGGDGPSSDGGDLNNAGNGGNGPSSGGSGGSGGTPGGLTGNPCTTNTECALGNCVDGVCCESACTGCKACAAKFTGKSDGTCAPVVGGQDPHNQCADVTATNECGTDGNCDGAGACRKVSSSHVCGAASCTGSTFKPVATCDGNGACPAPTTEDCGAYPCTTTGCAKTCSSQADCGGSNYCKITSGTTGTCTAKSTNGTAANNGFECTSGIVADGVCCDKACTGCMACTGAPLTGGAAGQCLNVVAGKIAHNACTASGKVCGLDGTCDGTGNCQSTPRQGESCDSPSNKCSTGAKCNAGTCTGAVTTTCAAPPGKCQDPGICNPATGICGYATSANGTGCDDGNACTVNDSCQAGACSGSAKQCAAASKCKTASTCSAGACSTPGNIGDGLTDSTCPSGSQYCLSGNCVGCTIDNNCGAPTVTCSPTSHTCVCRQPSSNNKLKNPGFDGSFSSWTANNVVLDADRESCSGSNSVFVENEEDNPRQCFAVTPGSYIAGGWFKGPQTGSFVRFHFWPQANCTGTIINTTADFRFDTITTDWKQYWDTVTVPAGTVSASYGVYGIQLYADQLFFGTKAQF